MNEEVKNAVIEDAVIEIEDHGILTAWLFLDYGGGGQGFGGYALDGDGLGPYAATFIRKTLDTVGVRKWSELKGKPVRVKGSGVKVGSIGHIIKDRWFCPREEFKTIELRVKTLESYASGAAGVEQ